MFEKNMKFALLLDFYGDLLDEHTRRILNGYYDDDLSLAEIAGDENISRQGVRHIIKKGEAQLEFFEEKLSLAEQNQRLAEGIAGILAVADRLDATDSPSVRQCAEDLRRAVNILRSPEDG